MAFVSDNEIDIELQQMKTSLNSLGQNQRTFANTFQNMKPRDRALLVQKIESDQRKISMFIERAKSLDIVNSGTKFGLENLRQSMMSLKVQWKKVMTMMEQTNLGVTSPGILKLPKKGKTSETEGAIKKYEETLTQMGHAVTPEHIQEFKANLDSAFKKASEMAGGKDLAIQVVQEEGKIKIRMVPK